jgi:hypothetical protein
MSYSIPKKVTLGLDTPIDSNLTLEVLSIGRLREIYSGCIDYIALSFSSHKYLKLD